MTIKTNVSAKRIGSDFYEADRQQYASKLTRMIMALQAVLIQPFGLGYRDILPLSYRALSFCNQFFLQ